MACVACIIARTNSVRLPKKVLKEVFNRSMIEHQIDRLKLCKHIDKIYICTSTTNEDYALKSIAESNAVEFYAGSEDSIIDRMLDVAAIEGADTLLRITGDNIFTDSVYTDMMIGHHYSQNADYTRTEFLPLGVTSEIISVNALARVYEFIPRNETQYLMVYLFQPQLFACNVLIPPLTHQHKDWSLTVDTPEDWERTKLIFDKVGKQTFCYEDILSLDDVSHLPYLNYKNSEMVKMPANLNLYFDSFRLEMDNRVNDANKIEVIESEYVRIRNEQQI
ncbi:MAG: hypothetical protein GQF41_0491 [Candidatus Rifleibacterium amylolyticum]|nr:MAG: hypothetical protein GQF41_0491 [Candidatus Rifleibacterium amylolyticum]